MLAALRCDTAGAPGWPVLGAPIELPGGVIPAFPKLEGTEPALPVWEGVAAGCEEVVIERFGPVL